MRTHLYLSPSSSAQLEVEAFVINKLVPPCLVLFVLTVFVFSPSSFLFFFALLTFESIRLFALSISNLLYPHAAALLAGACLPAVALGCLRTDYTDTHTPRLYRYLPGAGRRLVSLQFQLNKLKSDILFINAFPVCCVPCRV